MLPIEFRPRVPMAYSGGSTPGAGRAEIRSGSDPRIHDFADFLVYPSLHMTLQPGDVILAGTAEAVGFPTRDFLHLGDGSRIEVGGCSALENRAMEGT